MIQAWCPYHGLYTITSDEARRYAGSLLQGYQCDKMRGQEFCNEEIYIFLNGRKVSIEEILAHVGRKVIKE